MLHVGASCLEGMLRCAVCPCGIVLAGLGSPFSMHRVFCSRRTTATFLPSAYVMGMQPGVEVAVEVVVLAEDGVTSARYPVMLTRARPAWAAAGPTAEFAAGNVTYQPPRTPIQDAERGEHTLSLQVKSIASCAEAACMDVA